MSVISLALRDPRTRNLVEVVFADTPVFAEFLIARLRDLQASPIVVEILVEHLARLDSRERPGVVDLSLGADDPREPVELITAMRHAYGGALTDRVLGLQLDLKLQCARSGETFAEGLLEQNAGLDEDQIIPLGRLYAQCYGMLRGFRRPVAA